MNPIRFFGTTTRVVFASTICLLPTVRGMAYKHINPQEFALKQSAEILRVLGASELLLKINRVASDKMASILASDMVQGMAKGTLTKDEWDQRYMRADVLYIHKLGQELAKRAKVESAENQSIVMEYADMFLGYGKQFERLKKYGLTPDDKLDCQICENHITWLSKETSIDEFYVSILTDMIPYVVFSNYLLHSIEPSDNNPWEEYARKYGDLNNKYAREKLGKVILIANRILANKKVKDSVAKKLFLRGYTFEGWFIRNAFSKGFRIIPAKNADH